jgi:hypothetical protein
MTMMRKLRRRSARFLRWLSTGKCETRAIVLPSSQITQHSSFDAARGDQKQLLISRITVDQCDRSRYIRFHASSAPLKSP